MSKGSPIIGLRLPPEEYQALVDAIASNNESRKESPYDFSSWIRAAIRERLAKQARSRSKRKGGADDR